MSIEEQVAQAQAEADAAQANLKALRDQQTWLRRNENAINARTLENLRAHRDGQLAQLVDQLRGQAVEALLRERDQEGEAA